MLTRNVLFNKTYNYKLGLFLLCCIISLNSSFAQGDLLIFPKRIVFDGSKKVEKIILSNVGKESAVYNVSFAEYRMNKFGEFQAINEPDVGQNFASPFLRVFPRKVVLAPNESQTVKVQFRRTSDMLDGEYRSHLYFRADKNNKPLGQENKVIDSTAITVKLEAVFGISIATIIKKGSSTTVSTIADLNYTKDMDSNHILSFSINRKGNMSTYGDIAVNYVSNDNISYEVAKIRGIAVYTPGTIRKVKMLLKKPNNINFFGGVFKVVYTKNESTEVITEAVLNL